MVGNGRYQSRLNAKDDEEYQHGLAVQDLSRGQELLQNCPKDLVVVLTGARHVLGWFTDNNLGKIEMLSLSEAYGRYWKISFSS
jgi:hypothetical protein